MKVAGSFDFRQKRVDIDLSLDKPLEFMASKGATPGVFKIKTDDINAAVEEYRAHGFDEVCVPDFTMGGSASQRRENYEAFAAGVCANFR